MKLFSKLVPPLECKSRRFRYCDDRPRRLTAQVFSVLTLLSGLAYLAWIIATYNRAHPFAGGVFILAEICCLALFFLATLGLWTLRFKPLEGLPAHKCYSVDVFVTTYAEPMLYVSKTLKAATKIEYEGLLTIYVLDDGNRDEVRELAESLDIIYLSRDVAGVSKANAKSGNLNFGLKNSSGDLILTMDADQVPKPEIVKRLVGYMEFEKVAFVQSKQEYYTQSGDPFYNKSQVYYDVVELALDNNDNAFSAGTGVLYRRKALEELGGFVEWNIVEDFTTSYELHARGWKSFYFPHALSKGLAPTSIWGIYQQRGQWALDTMRIFLWDNPFFKKGLKFTTRVGYSTVAMSYICSAFIFPFFYLIPIWTYLTGNSILTKPEWQFLAIRSIYLIFMVIATQYLCYKQQPGKQFRMLAGLFPIYITGILRAFRYPKGKKPGYCVNNALNVCLNKLREMPPIVAVLPQMIILLLNMVVPFYALLEGTCDPRIVAANIFISGIAIWSMSQVVMSAITPGEYAPEEDPNHVYQLD